MVLDAVRGYWALASGLTDVTRHKATAAARALVGQGEATAEQISAIVEDLLSTSSSNRAALVSVVRLEVDRARSAIGVPTSSALEALVGRVAALESQVAALREAASAPGKPPATSNLGPPPATTSPTARRTAAKKTAAKAAPAAPTRPTAMASEEAASTTAKRTAAKRTAAEATAATKPPAKTTPAKTTPAKTTLAKTTLAKTTPAKKIGP